MFNFKASTTKKCIQVMIYFYKYVFLWYLVFLFTVFWVDNFSEPSSWTWKVEITFTVLARKVSLKICSLSKATLQVSGESYLLQNPNAPDLFSVRLWINHIKMHRNTWNQFYCIFLTQVKRRNTYHEEMTVPPWSGQ